jgi:hypothetical protein
MHKFTVHTFHEEMMIPFPHQAWMRRQYFVSWIPSEDKKVLNEIKGEWVEDIGITEHVPHIRWHLRLATV